MGYRRNSPLEGRIVTGGRIGGFFPVMLRRRRKSTRQPELNLAGLIEDRKRSPIGEFWRRSSIRRIVGGFAALAAVLALGTAGYVALGWEPADALFMVVITVSGVGFGEVHPIDTPLLRAHTIAVIGMGVISVAYTVAGFVQFVAEGEITQLLGHQRMRRQIDEMRDHTIVVGYGRMGSLLCAELLAAGEPFVPD